jgi:hypothetical protein
VLLFFLFVASAEGAGVVGVDGWDARGKTEGTEGDVGMVSVPFPAEHGLDLSILSDSGDFDRGRELLLCLEGVVISLQYPAKGG